jgi:hypothetical protein
LRAFAVETEVNMRADARLTVLKAFIRRGSGRVRYVLTASNMTREERLTWIADHAVLRPYGTNDFFAIKSTLTPRKIITFSHLGEVSIKLRALFVIRFDALSAVCSECVLVERVNVNRSTNLVDSSDICNFVSRRERLPKGGYATISEIAAGGRED